MIGLWYCYREDAAMLVESVAAFRQTFGDQAIVCLCDDGKAPLTAEQLAAVPWDHYERSDWRRVNNILGWESVLGILEFQMRMGKKFGGEGALKIDCDTLVLGADWLLPESGVCGFDAGVTGYAFGHCRWVRHETAAAVYHHILGHPLRMSAPVSEDQTIFAQAAQVGASFRIWPWPAHMVGWQYDSAEPSRDDWRVGVDVITFGNRMKSTQWGLPREVAARTMKEVRQWRS